MRTLAFLIASCLCASASAALPPFYDSVAQLKAVLEAEGLAEALQNHPVDSVARHALGFEVRGGARKALVDLIYYPPPEGSVGATTYTGFVVHSAPIDPS